MNIVYAADNNFIQHTFISIISVLAHVNPNHVNFFVFTSEIDNKNKAIIDLLKDNYGIKLMLINVDKRIFEKLPVLEHWNETMYYRFLIGDLLPNVVEKVIYLDGDTLINNDLTELWHIELGNKTFAAVPEAFTVKNLNYNQSNEQKCLNSGVLLIDLKAWRRQGYKDKLLSFIQENGKRLKFPDQDALNILYTQDWLELSPKWNSMVEIYFNKRFQKDYNYCSEELATARKSPSIIHYNQSFKPWHYQSRHPYKHLYQKYLSVTPWKGYVYPDKNLKNFIKKIAGTGLASLGLKAI